MMTNGTHTRETTYRISFQKENEESFIGSCQNLPKVGESFVMLFKDKNNKDKVLKTSTVNDIEVLDGIVGDFKLRVKTQNSLYYFEVI
jgi:hypothetical protein